MPRKPIELPSIEYLSILDEDANLDKALEPKIAPETLKTMYKYMLLARRTDERMLLMQRQGRWVHSLSHQATRLYRSVRPFTCSKATGMCLPTENWPVCFIAAGP